MTSKRVTHGENTVHILNGMPKGVFILSVPANSDIFFKGDVAVVTNRMENLVYHGKTSKEMDTTGVTAVWCGREQMFVTPEDFGKLLHAVYCGRSSRVKPIKP